MYQRPEQTRSIPGAHGQACVRSSQNKNKAQFYFSGMATRNLIRALNTNHISGAHFDVCDNRRLVRGHCCDHWLGLHLGCRRPATVGCSPVFLNEKTSTTFALVFCSAKPLHQAVMMAWSVRHPTSLFLSSFVRFLNSSMVPPDDAMFPRSNKSAQTVRTLFALLRHLALILFSKGNGPMISNSPGHSSTKPARTPM